MTIYFMAFSHSWVRPMSRPVNVGGIVTSDPARLVSQMGAVNLESQLQLPSQSRLI
jgi:hypothetical protein